MDASLGCRMQCLSESQTARDETEPVIRDAEVQQPADPEVEEPIPPRRASPKTWQAQGDPQVPPFHGLGQGGQAKIGESSAGPPAPDFSSFNDDDELPAPTERGVASSACAAAEPEAEASSDGSLTISTKIEYAALPSGQAQDVFGVVTVQAYAGEERQPLDIICVLDVSRSMKRNKLRLMQEAIHFVIKESGPKDRLSLIAFNGSATRVLRLARMSADGKNEATVAMLRLVVGPGTCISSGLEAALEVAERRKQRNPVSAILLLTDGCATRGVKHADGFSPLLARAQQAGCSLYAFGFGKDHDARLLATIAEQAHTPFTFVEDTDGIGPAFAGAMGGLSSVVAQHVELTLDCRVTLKACHTPFLFALEDDKTTIHIPDMFAGERRDVLVEVSIPAEITDGDTDMLLLTASARYRDLVASAARQTMGTEMRLRRTSPDEPQPEMEPDEEVIKQRDRVEVTQTLKAAAALAERANFAAARSMLMAHIVRFSAKNGKCEGVSMALAAELRDACHRMRSSSSWEKGGLAEVRDAAQMHRMQRATNANVSSKSAKSSDGKDTYCSAVQRSWFEKERKSSRK